MTTPQYISSSGQLTPPFGAHDTLNAYNPGDMVYANGNVYIANATIAAGTPFTIGASHFEVAVMGAESTSSISNGDSNVSIATADGDITMSSNAIANIVVISANSTASLVEIDGNVTATNIDAGNLLTANYISVGEIQHGNSNIVIEANSNIIISANGIANLLVIQDDGNIGSEANLFTINGNIRLNTIGQGVTFVGADAAGSLTNYEVFVTAPNVADFTANYTLTLPPTAGSNLQFLQTDGDGNTVWADASIKVSLQADSDTKPTDPLSGDTLVVTDTGLFDGTVLEEWVYDGEDWVQVIGTPPVSSSVLDNTIVDSDNATQIGTYIVPSADTVNAFVGHEDEYAAFDGSGFTFTAATDGDVVIINTGTNAGQCWKFTTAGGWEITNGGTLSVYNWVQTNAYPASALVIKDGNIYQANGKIAAGTAWATGTTGATWKAVSSGGANQVETFTATAGQTLFNVAITPVGAVAMYVNGILISANAVTVSGKQVTYVPANNGAYTLRVGDIVTITYMYGSINTNLVNAEYGSTSPDLGPVTLSPTGTYCDVLSFTLPSAGVWEVDYSARTGVSPAGGLVTVVITDNSDTILDSSQILNGYWLGTAPLDDTQGTVTGVARITTTGSGTYKLRAKGDYGAGGAAKIVSDNNGRTKVSWKKISGFTPITGITSTTTQFGNITAGTITQTSTTVALLPAAASTNAGMRYFVTDANTTTFYANVGGGGSNYAPVFSTGSVWKIG